LGQLEIAPSLVVLIHAVKMKEFAQQAQSWQKKVSTIFGVTIPRRDGASSVFLELLGAGELLSRFSLTQRGVKKSPDQNDRLLLLH
jgi:hypothetical protein